MKQKLTKEEQHVIRVLKNLSSHWPKTLWIFAAGGDLNVMRYNEKGERAITEFGGMDQEYIVDAISFPSDGGDW